MKIGITTYFNIKNYGSALQAFAMRHFLMQNGYDAVFLSIKERSPIDSFFHKLHVAAVTGQKCIFYKEARSTQKEIRELKQATASVITEEVLKMFSEFENQYLPSVSVGRRKLKRMAISQEYGAFICGSDQIWSPLSPHLSGFKFLNFAPKAKRIAYAPSFGVSEIPSYNRAFVKKRLSEIEDISVRELDGARIIKELSGRDVPVLLDPTMLLSGEQWRKIYRRSTFCTGQGKYILCYFFDEPDSTVISEITEFARVRGLKIKVLSLSNKGFIDNGAEYVNAGPTEFLSLVDNAEYIFTNSFHGCVFSVLFNKKFIAFGRNHSKAVKQTSRIETLLNCIGAKESFYNGEQGEQKAFIFPNVNLYEASIEPLRIASGKYLTQCLEKRRVK